MRECHGKYFTTETNCKTGIDCDECLESRSCVEESNNNVDSSKKQPCYKNPRMMALNDPNCDDCQARSFCL